MLNPSGDAGRAPTVREEGGEGGRGGEMSDAREREHGAARARRSVSWGEWARTLRPRKLARARLVPALLANRAPLRPVLAGEPLAVVAVRPLAVWAAVAARRVAAAAAAVAEGLGVHGQDVVPCEQRRRPREGHGVSSGGGLAWHGPFCPPFFWRWSLAYRRRGAWWRRGCPRGAWARGHRPR